MPKFDYPYVIDLASYKRLGVKPVPYAHNHTMGEGKVLRYRRPIKPSSWAEKHRVLTKSAIPGRWKNRTTPYLAGIMDASFHRSVEVVVIVATPQVGKSECVNNCVGYAIDRDPADILYVYPDELTANENSEDRIQPMITSSTHLFGYTTGYQDDLSKKRINLSHMTIYFSWANSPARLANKPIGKVICDEVDKYPATSGKKETSPIELARKRMTTYRGRRKLWLVSTPTIEEGPIWKAYQDATVRFEHEVKCPRCNEYQVMKENNIRVPKGMRDPKQINAENLAWYECEKCGVKWDDIRRNAAVRNGRWVSENSAKLLNVFLYDHNPQSIAFHIPSWLSPFVSLSEVMAAMFEGQKSKTKLKDYKNNYCAEPWVVFNIERKEDTLQKLADDRPAGSVPGGGVVACLTAGIDTQDHGFYYEIGAWGWGLKGDFWQIRSGYVASDDFSDFEAVKDVLFDSEYMDLEGNKYPIRLAIMDSAGHRTSEVYDFCRLKRNRVFPSKGEQTMATPIMWSNLEYYPGGRKPIPGGLKLLRVNTNYIKDKLANRLEVGPGDPGAWRFNSETTRDWLTQLCVEYKDEKDIWQCRPGRANHGWDCSVLNLAAAEVLGVRFWKQPGEEAAKPKKVKRAAKRVKLW